MSVEGVGFKVSHAHTHSLTSSTQSKDESLTCRRASNASCRMVHGLRFLVQAVDHPGDNPGANLQPISHKRYLLEVPFVRKVPKETSHFPLGCLQCGGRELEVPKSFEHVLQRLVSYCRTTSASTAPCTSRRRCCLTHCAGYCAPCLMQDGLGLRVSG